MRSARTFPPFSPPTRRIPRTTSPNPSPRTASQRSNPSSSPRIISPADAGYSAEPEALAASIAAGLLDVAKHDFVFSACADEYRARSAVLGERIVFTQNGKAAEGEAVSIDEDGALIVRCGDGLRRLSSGEISVRRV